MEAAVKTRDLCSKTIGGDPIKAKVGTLKLGKDLRESIKIERKKNMVNNQVIAQEMTNTSNRIIIARKEVMEVDTEADIIKDQEINTKVDNTRMASIKVVDIIRVSLCHNNLNKHIQATI